MTVNNDNHVNDILLAVCKEYIQITGSTPAKFAEELMDLASQSCEVRGTEYRKSLLELTTP